jgi:uncharacterized protein (TIGR02646 family)
VIRVKRPRTPRSLSGVKSPGGIERRKAIAFFRPKKNRELAYDKFVAYKGVDVIRTMERAFHGKCAYCESVYRATQPVDVEHYRPKGAITIDKKLSKPGYYWLAATWSNLLPSCIDCNRARTQEFENVESHLAGKANMFPVPDETRRARKPDLERREPRLLLHPYFDEPTEHLVFAEKGEVKARRDPHGNVSPMGVVSIDVCGLNRKGLTDERAKVQGRIEGLIVKAKRQALSFHRYPNDPDIRANLVDMIAELKGYCLAANEYAGMARQIIEPVLPELTR